MPLAKGRNLGRDKWSELRHSESATIACCSLLLLSFEVVIMSGHCINVGTLMGGLRRGVESGEVCESILLWSFF